ncbi:AMP-binding protein [Halomicrococcus sp. NG-SE-24]|uniref:AMP-binding protein n=1 Tax=Halomicrococcus sp. NG-SE-24 TaxID=3436928 RepID=UPI003D993590
MDVPQTVTAALEDRPVDEATCLETGAGVGNATAGLLANGARRVYRRSRPRASGSFEGLHRRSNRVANGLMDQDIGLEDPVALLWHNSPAFLELFFATQKIGATFTPINARSSQGDIEYILSDADPDYLMVESELLASISGLAEELRVGDDEVFVVGQHEEFGDFGERRMANETMADREIDGETVDGQDSNERPAS